MSCPTCGRHQHATWCRDNSHLGIRINPRMRRSVSPLQLIFAAAFIVVVLLCVS